MKNADRRKPVSASKSRTGKSKRPLGPQRAAASPNSIPENFDDYLATAPEVAREALIKMRQAIRSVVPAEAIEVISYKLPAFKLKKVLVWFGGFSDHCSLFPTAAVLHAFKDELQGYTTSKGTIQFPLNKPLPVALIKKLVKARVESI